MEQGTFKHQSGNLIRGSGNLSNRSGILAEHGEALIYIAADTTPGKPFPGYLEGILAAAVAAALPLAYQAELARGVRTRAAAAAQLHRAMTVTISRRRRSPQ
jgi:hypothetical protein